LSATRQEKLTPQDASVIVLKIVLASVGRMDFQSMTELSTENISTLERAHRQLVERLTENLRYAERQAR
jgi:ethanolamine utilization microcompartment shell protein EutS